MNTFDIIHGSMFGYGTLIDTILVFGGAAFPFGMLFVATLWDV